MVDTYLVKGIIFDMDNTILQSHIDFLAMKTEIFEFLVKQRVLPSTFPYEEHTSSTMIEQAKLFGIDDVQMKRIWEIASKHEIKGMDGVGLEQGVQDLLFELKDKLKLVVVTNNAYEAAIKALQLTQIIHYFDLIVGREQMSALKPSPSGFQHVLDYFQHIPAGQWISIGDSWIDGKASTEAGIRFISYRTSMDVMVEKGVRADGRIEQMLDLKKYISYIS